ncbi:MAG: Crp/Fnr family transcriptional regulator [Comamonadaceae bacterium]|nr:MAG: Crp/Fnr family transcriptional regulator [Comamonadaceae bacterium]
MTYSEPVSKTCPDCACRQQCLLGRQSDAVRASWAPHITERRFRKGEVLQRQGDAHTLLQVVKVGTLIVQREGGDGVDRPVGMAGCGQALGTPALLNQPADLTCLAVMPGRVCEVNPAAVARHGLMTPEFLVDFAHEQMRAHTRLADWARIMHVRGVTGQLAGALLQLADIQRSTLVRLPSHTVLASLLATTRETIARALAVLAQQQGVVRHDRWHCAIQRDALTQLSRGGRQLPRVTGAGAVAASKLGSSGPEPRAASRPAMVGRNVIKSGRAEAAAVSA